MSCSNILNDYDGVRHNYTRKGGLVWQEVFLPDNAPAEWADRSVLWNAVEAAENTKDSRLARMFVVALPVELNHDQQTALLTEYIRPQFVADGMCTDVALHDPDPPGHNPHAHILLTMRPLDERGDWQYKTEKEYLCVRGNEERGFTADEFTQAKLDGWEKQYPYKVGRKKVYMAPSVAEAQGLERASKHPKNTRYGRQNPITERWNSESQLLTWRASWAEVCNRHLEMAASEARIDHRSNVERGIDEQPTVHEGVAARMIEKRGGVSFLCEMNRQIRADNALLRELKALVQRLSVAAATTAETLAAKLESCRAWLLVLCFQRGISHRVQERLRPHVQAIQERLARYDDLTQRLKEITKYRKALQAERDSLSPMHLLQRSELQRQINQHTEDMEELRSERAILMTDLGEISLARQDAADREAALMRAADCEENLSEQIDEAVQLHVELLREAQNVDASALSDAREAQRPQQEQQVLQHLQASCGERFDSQLLHDSRREVQTLLGEAPMSIREQLTKIQSKSRSPDISLNRSEICAKNVHESQTLAAPPAGKEAR